jgi:signal transduction histidine kinase
MDTVIAVAALVALGAFAAAREVSARRRLARAGQDLADAQARLQARNDLASVGQLVSGLAHELKSPLQGVLGNTEVMLASSRRDASTEELQQIRDDANRAAGIVRHLLAFTETTTLSRRWHDVNAVVARAIDACRGDLETSGARVQIAATEPLPLVYVDSRQLEKVIMTLLVRPPAACLAAAGAAAGSTVTVATRRGNDRLMIDLDDRTLGAGADEPAWAADIAACRRVLEAHGGSLEVECRDATGFRFHMELPVAAAGIDRPSS